MVTDFCIALNPIEILILCYKNLLIFFPLMALLSFVLHPKKDFSTKFLHVAPWCIEIHFSETGLSLYFLSKSKTNVPSSIYEIIHTLLCNLKCELFHRIHTHTCLGFSNADRNYLSSLQSFNTISIAMSAHHVLVSRRISPSSLFFFQNLYSWYCTFSLF